MENSRVTDRKPRGGTELMVEALRKSVPETLLSQVHISVSAVQSAIKPLKPHIFWAHQSYDQPSVQNLHDPLVQQAIDCFVFVSDWQREKYVATFGIAREKTTVIRNAVEPFSMAVKPPSPLTLVYTSTPFRGLDVLLSAFRKLNRQDIELHIYSGMALYGRPEEDARFEALYANARTVPGVRFHGAVRNEEVRKALLGAHIFVYPSTWEETSCVSLIEALSAGCLAVTSDLGALPETASGFALQYPYTSDVSAHVTRLVETLGHAIDRYADHQTQQRLATQVEYFATHYSWTTRAHTWEQFLNEVVSP